MSYDWQSMKCNTVHNYSGVDSEMVSFRAHHCLVKGGRGKAAVGVQNSDPRTVMIPVTVSYVSPPELVIQCDNTQCHRVVSSVLLQI